MLGGLMNYQKKVLAQPGEPKEALLAKVVAVPVVPCSGSVARLIWVSMAVLPISQSYFLVRSTMSLFIFCF